METTKTEGVAAVAPATTCYALKVYSYDYYEWEEVLAVSFHADKLRDHYKVVDHLYNDAPLVEDNEHRGLAGDEKPHWVIEEVLFLHNKLLSHP